MESVCLISVILFIISKGPAMYPIRQPVIAYVLEKPFKVRVLSFISSSDPMDRWV